MEQKRDKPPNGGRVDLAQARPITAFLECRKVSSDQILSRVWSTGTVCGLAAESPPIPYFSARRQPSLGTALNAGDSVGNGCNSSDGGSSPWGRNTGRVGTGKNRGYSSAPGTCSQEVFAGSDSFATTSRHEPCCLPHVQQPDSPTANRQPVRHAAAALTVLLRTRFASKELSPTNRKAIPHSTKSTQSQPEH